MFFKKRKEEKLRQEQEAAALKKQQEEEARRQEEEARLREYNRIISEAPNRVIVAEGNLVKRKTLQELPDIHLSNITKSTNLDKLFPMVVLDTETTDIKMTGRIVEIGALKLTNGFVLTERFTTLINPQRPIPAEAFAVNHISDEMVANAPTFGEIAGSLQEFVSGCTIVGHNLMFDLKFLHCSGINFPAKGKYIDTLDLVKRTLKRDSYNSCDISFSSDVSDYKLETLCHYYGIYRPEGHRAEADAFATAVLLQHLIEDKTGIVI